MNEKAKACISSLRKLLLGHSPIYEITRSKLINDNI